jgi:hypothetical protein
VINETQILADRRNAERLRSVSPSRGGQWLTSFRDSIIPFGRSERARQEEAIMQNKANFKKARRTLTIVQKKGYEKTARVVSPQKQSQFSAHICPHGASVPARLKMSCGDARPTKRRPPAALQAGPVVQNKANSYQAESALTAAWKKSYDEKASIIALRKQSQLPGPNTPDGPGSDTQAGNRAACYRPSREVLSVGVGTCMVSPDDHSTLYG